MLDIKKLNSHDPKYLDWIRKKGWDLRLVHQVVKDYKELNDLKAKLDDKRARQNVLAKLVVQLTWKEKADSLDEMKWIKEYIRENEPKKRHLSDEVDRILASLPNPAHESVIEWASDEDNKVIRLVWTKPVFDFEPKPHWDLGKELDLIDSERWAKVTGARFHFLKNELVFLQFALVQYALNLTSKYWFKPILPPYLVNKSSAFGTWYLESGHEDEVYCVNPGLDDLYLIWTSEIPNTAYYANEIIPEEQLPLRISAYSPCFRREAWSAWKDERGILRCHQFDKVEMGVFAHPDRSWEEHALILKIEEEIFAGLWLHYQVIDICAWDLGGPASKKYDLEAWMPWQWKYREVTSTSNCTDFQARRLKIRVKKNDWTNEILHTLNWTAIAVWRALIAIMENYQTSNGEIIIPEVLRVWTWFDKISKKTK